MSEKKLAVFVIHKSQENILKLTEFFSSVNSSFTTPLSARTELDGYAEKILTKAVVLGVEIGENLVGLASFYANDLSLRKAYLTVIAVKPELLRRGIATQLIQEMISIVTRKKMCSVVAITDSQNIASKNMYIKNGFVLSAERENRATFIYTINEGK